MNLSPRTSLALLVPAAVLCVSTGAAVAHTEVESTRPAADGTAKTSIRAVTVTFSGPIQRGSIRVRGPGRAKVSRGDGGRDPHAIDRLRVRLEGGLRPGRYRAKWSVVAADGHGLRGSFTFRLVR